MFLSLNKKFFSIIFAFFILSASIFLLVLDGTVGEKMRTDYNNIMKRNQYVIALLNEMAVKNWIGYNTHSLSPIRIANHANSL